eukprot:TRINITY_DN1484_c0_g2_i1.p1 TRINITY_DN1484_c0_g2~~TRINITY_DN1484_c0_g2_i1.p1  ORF type:complete len:473 (+),score=45.33 TRINITY_DN1484_c0_g2_i1:153-1421(+)
MSRAMLLCAAGAMGLAVSCYRAKRRLRKPLPGGAEVLWEAKAVQGDIRVVESGVWTVNSYHSWDDILYVNNVGTSVTIVMMGGWKVNVLFDTADQSVDFTRYFRKKLYPEKPFTIHVIINPKSGRGHGSKIFEKTVKPVFSASPHTVNVHTTHHSKHATQLIQDLLLIKGDTVAVVGGDGVLNEIVNGLLLRTDISANDVTLGVIPCGSGNGLSASVGIRSVESASKAIVKSHSIPLDALEFNQDSEATRYGFLSVTAACIADVDIRSEFLRFLGALRFSVYGLYLIACKKTWRLSFVTPELDAPNPVSGQVDFFVVSSVSHIAESTNIAPSARTDDGLLHLQWVPSEITSRASLVTLFNQLESNTGEHVLSPSSIVEYTTTAEVVVTEIGDENIVTLDGELMPCKPFTVTCLPSKLRLVAP